MKPFLHEMLRLAKMRSGRRISLYKKWQPIIDDFGLTAVTHYINRALAHDGITRQLENRWVASNPKRRYSTGMPTIDSLVDQMLFGIVKLVDAQTSGLRPDDPLVVSASQLKDDLFPAGVHAITSLAYVDQAAAVEGIVEQLQGSLAAHVSDLGLGRLVTRLADAVVEYRQTVDSESGNVLYTQVQAFHRRGLDYLAEILCMVVADFHDSDNPHHMAARARFLAPLIEHDRQSRLDRRRRRARAAPDLPGDDLPDDDLPGDDLPDDDLPGDYDLPGDDLPGDDLSGDDLSGDSSGEPDALDAPAASK